MWRIWSNIDTICVSVSRACTDKLFCLSDPCFHGGVVRSGMYCQCKMHVENECSSLYDHVPTMEENRVSLNSVSAKSKKKIIVVHIFSGPTVEEAGLVVCCQCQGLRKYG